MPLKVVPDGFCDHGIYAFESNVVVFELLVKHFQMLRARAGHHCHAAAFSRCFFHAEWSFRMRKLLGIALVMLASSQASAGLIYAAYTGSQNGVTVRDSETFEQLHNFNLAFAVDRITAGNDSLYLSSGNHIYRYSTSGQRLNSFDFGTPVNYGDISFAGPDFYTAYTFGRFNGVTVRDSVTLQQSNFFSLDFVVDGIGAGKAGEMYLSSANQLFRYSDSGTQLAQMTFPSPSIEYGGISYSASSDRIYVAYDGIPGGITVRDAGDLEQISFFQLDFVVNDLVAGLFSDLYLTSGNSIYRYRDDGEELGRFTFPDSGIVYQGIAFMDPASIPVPEPGTLGLLLAALGALALVGRRRAHGGFGA